MVRIPNLPRYLSLLSWTFVLVGEVKAQPVPEMRPPVIGTETQVGVWLDRNREYPDIVRAFIQRMPKGADIHTHLGGAIYAEEYLQWAAADGYCADVSAIKLVAPENCPQNPNYITVSDLIIRKGAYDEFIKQWTNYQPEIARNDKFFQAFQGVELISSSPHRRGDMVAAVRNRAANQQISYLELIIKSQLLAVQQLARSSEWNENLPEFHRQLFAKGLLSVVANGRKELQDIERRAHSTLGCETARAQIGCQVKVRFLGQTSRSRSPAEVFTQLTYNFELARTDSRVVGINLAAPEDHPLALRDYTLHMKMIDFLRRQSPGVKVSLHAGELNLGLVPPDDLRFHIRQAIEIARADRIGHGVDIFNEEGPFALIKILREGRKLVEICLTSNERNLTVKGENHPFRSYLESGVPITLASDDEGLLRIDLSHEYQLAFARYKLKYSDLKLLARNSLEYSFLPGQSIWQSSKFESIHADCAKDSPGTSTLSKRCQEWLEHNERAKMQWKLESDLIAFESLHWLDENRQSDFAKTR